MKEVAITVREKIKSVVNSMGYDFVGCEWSQQGRRHSLRIYIDRESGVTLADCTQVSRQLGAMLDVEEPAERQYLLEVSSPGIDRPLFEVAHYHKQIGQRIKLRLQMPMQDRRNWVGTLIKVGPSEISLLVDESEIVIPFSNIEKANVVADIHY